MTLTGNVEHVVEFIATERERSRLIPAAGRARRRFWARSRNAREIDVANAFLASFWRTRRVQATRLPLAGGHRAPALGGGECVQMLESMRTTSAPAYQPDRARLRRLQPGSRRPRWGKEIPVGLAANGMRHAENFRVSWQRLTGAGAFLNETSASRRCGIGIGIGAPTPRTRHGAPSRLYPAMVQPFSCFAHLQEGTAVVARTPRCPRVGSPPESDRLCRATDFQNTPLLH